MRPFVVFFLIFSFVSQSAFAIGDDTTTKPPGPVVRATGVNGNGERVVYESAYVEGKDAENVTEAAIQTLEGSKDPKLIVSTDDIKNPLLNKFLDRINKFPKAAKFLFSPEGVNYLKGQSELLKVRSKETYSSMKEDPSSVFVLFAMTAVNTTLYIHFVQHPGFLSVGVPVIITFLGNALYMWPKLFDPLKAPVDNIKGKVETLKKVAKKGEARVGQKLGLDTQSSKFHDFQEISILFGVYAAATFIFAGLTSHGFEIPNIHSAIYLDALLNGVSNAPLMTIARRWRDPEYKNSPLTPKGVDWLLRTQRFALAILFPFFYVAHDTVGYVGVATVGVVGWLAFFKGDQIIPAIKENAYVKNSAKLFSDLYDSFNEKFIEPAKSDAKEKVAFCSEWIKSLKK
jgi:hypothetical protein